MIHIYEWFYWRHLWFMIRGIDTICIVINTRMLQVHMYISSYCNYYIFLYRSKGQYEKYLIIRRHAFIRVCANTKCIRINTIYIYCQCLLISNCDTSTYVLMYLLYMFIFLLPVYWSTVHPCYNVDIVIHEFFNAIVNFIIKEMVNVIITWVITNWSNIRIHAIISKSGIMGPL